MLEDERLEGKKRDGYNRRQQVFHTLQQIDKSFQRPQKLCRFNQITGQNSEFSLSRNVPIQKFGCTIIVSTRRWVDIMFCLSSVFVHFFLFMSKISLCWFHLHVHALNARDIKVQRSTISTKIALLFRRSHSYFFHLFSTNTVIFFGRFFKWERESRYETPRDKISEITATNIVKVPSDGKIAPTD